MKKTLKIVFMGTPDFAVATLKALVENNYNIVGVITAPDKPAGRGQKLRESAVKKYAVSKNLNVLQPPNLKDIDFIAKLKTLKADLQIVVAFRMLPKIVWQMPEFGTFNLHASLLPNYRGAAPIHWAIINGEKETGVTTFFIDDKIDTGAIILKKSIAIATDETVGELHDKLMVLGSLLVINTIERIEEGTVTTTIQSNNESLNLAPKLNKENCKINWDAGLDDIYNLIRGLNPFPGAWCYLKKNNETLNIKIFAVNKQEELHNYSTGSIITQNNQLKVAVKSGYILINELQLPGKRKMNVLSLLNGYSFSKDAQLL